MEHLRIIANPESGGGKGSRVLKELVDLLRKEGFSFDLDVTETPGHAETLAAAARDAGASRILAVGGDGTIHEVVNGMLSGRSVDSAAGSNLPSLIVLPVGTGNDFHRMVGPSGGLAGIPRLLRDGITRRFEVGWVGWEGGSRYFVNLLGVGIDVEVLRRRPAFRRFPGILQYLGAFASALTRFRPLPIVATLSGVDGKEEAIEGKTLIAAITVGPSIGGGFFLSPHARPDDGLLDLCLVHQLGVFKVARYLPGILKGDGVERDEIHRRQSAFLMIRGATGERFSFELDGELMNQDTSFLEIRAVPEAIPVVHLPAERGAR